MSISDKIVEGGILESMSAMANNSLISSLSNHLFIIFLSNSYMFSSLVLKSSSIFPRSSLDTIGDDRIGEIINQGK